MWGETKLSKPESRGTSQVFTQPGCGSQPADTWEEAVAAVMICSYEVFCTTWAGKPPTLLAVSQQHSVDALQNRGEMVLDVFSVWKLGITTFRVVEWYSLEWWEVVSGLTGVLAAVLSKKGAGFLFCCWIYTIPLPSCHEGLWNWPGQKQLFKNRTHTAKWPDLSPRST